MTTKMYRKMTCTICNYSQEDFLSYYLHRKVWDKNHDIAKCLLIRREMSAVSANLALAGK